MDVQYLAIFGGIGLFVLGMQIFTDGLTQLAGRAFRTLLARFTTGPLSGAVTGALATALVQSSTAVTVTAVGFVGAGLLTFQQTLGIIFGANIGTTLTGWLVTLVGFKLQLGVAALPLLFVAVMLKRFASGRLALVGWALAGFSLLFVGLAMLQQGMAPLKQTITPEILPGDGFGGRLLLLLFGAALTVITQSSSAGVATALVALGAGTISFPQAAAMVIGMDIGTTFSAALAAFGGSTAMRRTGYAHVIFNLMTGVMAFFLLDLYAVVVNHWLPLGNTGDAQVALVGFHTLFNAFGVVVAVPLTSSFATLIKRLVPERGPPLLRHLDDRLLNEAAAASDAALACVRDIAAELLALLACLLRPVSVERRADERLLAVHEALAATRHFVERIRTDPHDREAHRRHLAAMHALDHLQRLAYRCAESQRLGVLPQDARLRRLTRVLRGSVERMLAGEDLIVLETRFDRVRQIIRHQRQGFRDRTVRRAADQEIDAETTLLLLDAIRWLHRVAHHVWRISHHLREGQETKLQKPEVVLPPAGPIVVDEALDCRPSVPPPGPQS